MRIAPQECRAGAFLQHTEITAQCRLGNFQAARPGGNAAALHNANKGAEQGEVIECGHPIFEKLLWESDATQEMAPGR